jgi:iron complex transport system substrate-binding protein
MRSLRHSARIVAMLAAAGTVCAGASMGTPLAATVTDAGGRKVEVVDTSKILSIGGDITEILYALGLSSRIIAVDSTSQFPADALKQKGNVGYMRALSTEGVLSVGANLIIASERSGPPEVVKALKQTAIPYVEVPDGLSPEGVIEKVRFVARTVEASKEGDELAGNLDVQFKALAEQRAAIKRPVRALFLLNMQGGRATVGGSGTSADAILKLAGAENAAASVNGFKPMVDEALVEMMPDVIVAMKRYSSGSHDAEQVLSMKGMQATPAGAVRRVVTMDGLYLLGFGPRTPAAALDLMRELYPDLPASASGLVK